MAAVARAPMAAAAENRSVPQDLSAEELEGMLGELVERYREPAFQAALSKALAIVTKQGLGLQAVLGPLVLQVQRPVLEKYGLPPNAQGVDLMKHAVHRRITEGGDRVEALANEARRLLGIEQLPNRGGRAEEKLAASAAETAARFGAGNPAAVASRREECRQVLQNARRILPANTVDFLESLLESEEGSIPAVLCLLRMAQLGMHADALAGRGTLGTPPSAVAELHAPSTQELFDGYVFPGRPAVIRGAFDEASFPLLRDLPDFNFLRRKCGHRRVLVKSLGFDDEDGRSQFMSDPELKLPLVAFLEAVEAYEANGTKIPFYLGKVPLRAELPELAEEIARSPSSPARWAGCFGDHIREGVYTYFGCGRNTTTVHFDVHENLLLCVCGTKHLWLYPPSETKYLYPISKERTDSIDFSRSAVIPFRRHEDLSPELQGQFPLLARARPIKVTLQAGDVLYLPSCWWHCVEGSEERNIILNWWFCVHPQKRAMGQLQPSSVTAG